MQLGHHITIIEFAQKYLGTSSAALFALFDRMRHKQNDAFYDIALISDTEAEEAVKVSEDYLKVISSDVATRLCQGRRGKPLGSMSTWKVGDEIERACSFVPSYFFFSSGAGRCCGCA